MNLVERRVFNAVHLIHCGYPCLDYIAGDILIWERKEGVPYADVTITIGERGPVTTKIQTGIHFGIYEGDGMVSDLTFDGDTIYPRIRLMALHDHPTPARILRIDQLK